MKSTRKYFYAFMFTFIFIFLVMVSCSRSPDNPIYLGAPSSSPITFSVNANSDEGKERASFTWDSDSGDLVNIVVKVEYRDQVFTNDGGYAGYYIGGNMTYALLITNYGSRDLLDMEITAILEYYQDKTMYAWWWSPPQTVTVSKGEVLNGDSIQVWDHINILAGSSIELIDTYTIPWEIISGLDQTHVIIKEFECLRGPSDDTGFDSTTDEGLTGLGHCWDVRAALLYDSPEAGVFDPPVEN